MVDPRLLVIDFTRIDGLSATGQLKAALLRDWRADHVLQLYGSGMKSLSFAPELWNPEADFWVKPEDDPIAIVEDFAPEVIYYRPLGNCDRLHRVAMKIIETLNLPYVIHMMDDWPQRMRLSDPGHADRYEADLRALLSRSFVNLSICDAMSNAFGERYGTEFVPVANGLDDALIETLGGIKKRKSDKPFRIRYMGGLAPDMTKQAVLDVAAAVETLRAAGKNIELDIYTMPRWLKKANASFTERDGVSLYPSVDKEQYYRLIGESDVCLIAYNFDRSSLAYTKYSMANKLPEIMASRAVLLAYGPKQAATMAYVQSQGVGVCVTERDHALLVDTLGALIDRPEEFRQVSAEARRRVRRAHRISEIRERFCGYLRAAERAGPAPADGAGPAYGLLQEEAQRNESGLALTATAPHAERSEHAVVLPTFRRKERLNDFLARAAWFLPHTGIDRLTVFASRQTLKDFQWQLPDGFDPVIKDERFSRLEKVLEFVEITGPEKEAFDQQEPHVEEAKLVYFYDSNARERWSGERQQAALAGKLDFAVDPIRDKNEGAAYLETSSRLLVSRQALVDENRSAFLNSSLLNRSYDRSIILATGPSISDYRRFDTEGAMVIACNSVIKSRDIMDRVQPQILVFADPIFHYGPSVYAAAFRHDLEHALARYDFTIVTPMKYYSTLLDTVPSAAGRLIAVPFERDCGVVMDLQREFRTKTTDNILTLLMLPLAFSFSDEVMVLGCDGRPLEDNDYFWKHGGEVQYADKMSTIKQVHPSFFAMDYDDYYARHLFNTERFVQMADAQGKTFVSGGFSHIPAMKKRALCKRIAEQGVAAGGQRARQAMIVDLGDTTESDHHVLALLKTALEEVSRAPVEVASLQSETVWWASDWRDSHADSVLTEAYEVEEEPWSLALLRSATGNLAPLTGTLGHAGGLDVRQSARPLRLRQAVESLLGDGERFIRSELWQDTRVSLSADLDGGPLGGRDQAHSSIYLNLRVPLGKQEAANRNRSNGHDAGQAVTLSGAANGATRDHIHLDVEDAQELFSKHLSSWCGVVYCRTARIVDLADALKAVAWQDKRQIDLVVDVTEALLDYPLRDQIMAGRAIRWLVEAGESRLSSLRVRTTSEAVSRALLGSSGLALEMAPPVNASFRDHVWQAGKHTHCCDAAPSDPSPSRVLLVADGRSTKCRKLAYDAAKALALEGETVNIFLRGGDETQAEAITEDSVGKGQLKTMIGPGLERQALDEAGLVAVIAQDLAIEQGFYDVAQKAVLRELPLVLWSGGRLGARCAGRDLGVAYAKFDRNTILRAVRATRTNQNYYKISVKAALETFGAEASWRNAAADLFTAGRRPEVAEDPDGLKPTGIVMQGAASNDGAIGFSIPKAAKQNNLLFIFAAPVQAGDSVRVEVRVRTASPDSLPLRICRHGCTAKEGSDHSAPGCTPIGDGVFLIWREYTFKGDHAHFRAEIGSVKGSDLHLDILDISASPLN
ncbi:MAG: hypothetical protein RIC87_22755 [Kiloniellales bacterium]